MLKTHDVHRLILTTIKVIYILVTYCLMGASGPKALWLTFILGAQKNYPIGPVLLSTHNVCFG